MENLRKLRKEKGLNQSELADILDLKQRTYNAYELGVNEPSIEVLKKLSSFFNVSIDYLVGNDIRGLTVYSEEQNQAINMLVQLNELNLSRASSYIAGLLVGQN